MFGTRLVYLCSVEIKTTAKMKTNNNNPLGASDQIVAQLESNGHVLASVNTSNIGSIDEIIVMIKALAGKFMGLARLTVRNKTQGWSQVISLASRRCAAPIYSRPTPQPVMQGRQYVIPFG